MGCRDVPAALRKVPVNSGGETAEGGTRANQRVTGARRGDTDTALRYLPTIQSRTVSPRSKVAGGKRALSWSHVAAYEYNRPCTKIKSQGINAILCKS